MKRLLSLVLVLGLTPLALAQSRVDASAPMEKKDPTGRFLKKHESFLQRGKEGPIGVLFLGDSITEGWVKAPHVWAKYYGSLEPANFGIGGDQTQHVLWRIDHGELDNLHPKVVVLMIGTNNSASNTGEEIAAADQKIIAEIKAKDPGAKVLLLAIFPRGAKKDKSGVITDAAVAEADKRMQAIRAANAILAKLDDGSTVRYLDIGAVFLGQDGKIPFSLMPDQLHPNAAGYQLWADAMEPTLKQMLSSE